MNISPQTTFVLNGVTAYLSSETSRDKSSKSHFAIRPSQASLPSGESDRVATPGRLGAFRAGAFRQKPNGGLPLQENIECTQSDFVNPTRLGFCSADTESTKTAVTKPTSSGNSIGAGGGTEKHLR
ncbi:hypothetical protein, partial [Mesorhizobium sp. P5_C1]